jgi:1,2-diacylglycerol 3-beta-galactosyltransferase
MPIIHFVYFDAGGGHRAAATALQQVLEKQHRPWDVQLVNLQEVLDSIDVFRKMTGIRLEDLYNEMLAKGWTLGSAQWLKLVHAVIRMYHRKQVRVLSRYWCVNRPDMVVSLVPNFNRAMFQALQSVWPGVPYVTILTDFADFPPHFWMERQDQYVICGTDWALAQARRMRYREDRIFRVSGMILRPQFYEPVTEDRAAGRRRLGLAPDVPTALMLFGGHGSRRMLEILERLQSVEHPLQLIAMCGRNQELARDMRAFPSRLKMHVEGFNTNVPAFMHLADFFIGKPGPGSISEAIEMGLPVVLERNAWTLPQERYNTEWVEEKQVGVVLESFSEVAEGVNALLANGSLERFAANARAIRNRAVFEIPDILAHILENEPSGGHETQALPESSKTRNRRWRSATRDR